MLPLLTASPSPRFCFIGSALGSIGGMGKCPIRMAEYGMSKAMAHYLVRKIHFEYGSENGKLVAWCVHPG
jgi:norsolorinic acid ketoreductase